jgi:hypothetical protein
MNNKYPKTQDVVIIIFDHQNNKEYKNNPPSKNIYKDYYIFNEEDELEDYLETNREPGDKISFFIHANLDGNFDWVSGDFAPQKKIDAGTKVKPAVFFKNKFDELRINYLTRGDAWVAIKEKGQRNVFNYGELRKHFEQNEIVPQLVSDFFTFKDPNKVVTKINEEKCSNDSAFVIKLINNFHNVARQIINRYKNRETIAITDEYDVQDLLYGLLRIEYEDIRAEEYTPSYAGSATRMDFLLKKEKTVIEVKKTRSSLKDKEVGEQLIIDIMHYKTHMDCKKLICFVYDPENKIKNPRGLEGDLNSLSSADLIVEVYIRPL